MDALKKLANDNRILKETVIRQRSEIAQLKAIRRKLLNYNNALKEQLEARVSEVKRLPLMERRRIERKLRK